MPLLHRRTEPDTDLREHLDPYERDGSDRVADTDRRHAAPVGGVAPAAVDERVSMTTHQGWNSAVRVVALAVSAVPVLLGIIALVRMDWTDGLDSPAVDVAGLAFTPVVAIVTLIAGLVALAAAASPDRGSKLVVGAILACAGLGLLVVGDAERADLEVERAFGWLALFVGAVLVLAGILLRRSWTSRRTVSTRTR
jgi:hypothetical protein